MLVLIRGGASEEPAGVFGHPDLLRVWTCRPGCQPRVSWGNTTPPDLGRRFSYFALLELDRQVVRNALNEPRHGLALRR